MFYRKGKSAVEGGGKWLLPLCLLALLPSTINGQRLLTLDSCRTMALRNNKQMRIAKVQQELTANLRKSARTKYLPHVNAVGSYVHTSKEISILSDHQKGALSGLGTNFATGLQQRLGEFSTQLPMEGLGRLLGSLGIDMNTLQQALNQNIGEIGAGLNGVGQRVVDAFRTDTRNIWAGSVVLTQPVFMGGAIVAMNKMADAAEDMMANSAVAKQQATIYGVDRAYWQVVSLTHKKKLAEGYRDLVKKLDGDVNKMIKEGVATRSDGLSVAVKVNEAEMAVTKVNDGLVLSKMLLCQICGLPVDEKIILADENADNISVIESKPVLDVEQALNNRPELKMLQSTVDLTRHATRLMKAGNLPKVLLTGGYSISNPNLFNSFEKKFSGVWNIGVLVHVPVWNWGDVMYKVRAAKGANAIARLELDEAREKIELQVNQNTFRVEEANKKLAIARTNIARAEENLRTADLGFQEGVITPATVMEAQTAWLQAQSQKIDAEIDVKLSQVDLKKSLGTLE